MKIVCETSVLSAICANLQRCVSAKNTVPALDCILIDATGDEINLTSYDLEIGCMTSIGAYIEEKGKVAINAKYLCDILRFLPDSKVSIESDNKDICKIISGDTEYSLIGTSAEVYPDLPNILGKNPIVLPQDVLKDMIRKTIYAVANTDARPVHTGIKFEIEDGLLTLVALDGFRLAVRKEYIDYNGDNISFVVPSKTLNEILKYMETNDNNISIIVSGRHIAFNFSNYKLISRLLEGEFLNYKSAIPTKFNTVITVGTKELIECTERTSLLVSTEKIKTPIRCLVEDNELKLSNTTTMGRARDKCFANIEGETIEIGFNARFMIDALKVCDEDKIKIQIFNGSTPIILTPLENEKFLSLILPMRLKNENDL